MKRVIPKKFLTYWGCENFIATQCINGVDAYKYAYPTCIDGGWYVIFITLGQTPTNAIKTILATQC